MSLTISCSAIVFDLDGVLVDSGDTVVAAWQQLCVEFALDPSTLGPLHGVRTVDALPRELPVDAILGAAKQMHTVFPLECTGCEKCVEPCPVDCITMEVITKDISSWQWPYPEQLREAS